MTALDKTYWAWLAGIIEGEGCLTVALVTKYSTTMSKLVPRMEVEMTDYELVRQLYKNHGGAFRTFKRGEKFKRVGRWYISNALQCLTITQNIAPHVKGNKRKQVQAFIEHLETRLQIKGKPTPEQALQLWETANTIRKHSLGKPRKEWTAQYKAVRKQQCKSVKTSKDTPLKSPQPVMMAKAAKRAERSTTVK